MSSPPPSMPLMRQNSRAARSHVRLVTIERRPDTRHVSAGASTHPHTDCCSSPHTSHLYHTPTARPPDIHCLARPRPRPVNARQFPGRPSAPSQSSSKFRGARAPPSKSIQISDPVRALLDPPYNLYEKISPKSKIKKKYKKAFSGRPQDCTLACSVRGLAASPISR